jgi:hypothetical protein
MPYGDNRANGLDVGLAGGRTLAAVRWGTGSTTDTSSTSGYFR